VAAYFVFSCRDCLYFVFDCSALSVTGQATERVGCEYCLLFIPVSIAAIAANFQIELSEPFMPLP
jgi:hypothetical protein